jgi:FixJ family two-component response regulator
MGTPQAATGHEPCRVFLVDDDPSVRRSLERLLRSSGHEVESFASAREFLLSDHGVGAACLLLDLCMPEFDGFELQAELERIGREIPVIFVTGNGNLSVGVRAMKAGAFDFLPKPVNAPALLASVDSALQRALETAKQSALLAALRLVERRLTPREHEVMGLVVEGLLNKQIAAKLGVSEKTVKIHRARVMEKTEVRSLADLVRFAARLGIPAMS